jgi:MYND finger
MSVQDKFVCHKCGKVAATMKRCTGCHLVSYCSAACQKTSWKDHKASCKAMAAAAGTPIVCQGDKNRISQHLSVLDDVLHVRASAVLLMQSCAELQRFVKTGRLRCMVML